MCIGVECSVRRELNIVSTNLKLIEHDKTLFGVH